MKIGENVYALESTKGSYAYLINDKEVILIDTGRPGKFKSILNEIESYNCYHHKCDVSIKSVQQKYRIMI